MKSLPILAFLVSVAIGWNVAGNSRPAGTSGAPAEPVPARGPARPERTARLLAGPDEVSRRQLAAIRASRDPALRMRATVDLARSLSPEDFAAWVDGGWFDVRGGAELTLFTKILQERWEAEDAEGLLAWSMKNDSGQAEDLLNRWAKNDPQRLLGYFAERPDPANEVRALSKIASTDPALAMRRLQKLIAEGAFPVRNGYDYSSELLGAVLKRSPATLAASLASLTGDMKVRAEALIIGSRFAQSPDEEFQKLLDRPDGFGLLQSIVRADDPKSSAAARERLLGSLRNWPAAWRAKFAESPYGFINRESAEQWATADLEGAGFTDRQADSIRAQALSNLANKPETALKLLSEFEMEDNYRRNVIMNVFGNNPAKTGELLKLLDSEEDRKIAMSMADSQKTASTEQPIDTPEAWLSGLSELGKNSYNTYRFISAARGWDQARREELKQRFQALPEDSKRSVAENLLRNSYGETGPLDGEAIRFFILNPVEAPAGEANQPRDDPQRVVIERAARYVGMLAQKDPTAAGDWIATLPSGEPKHWAQKNLHALWSQYDPAAAREWLAGQPAADRAAVEKLSTRR